MSMAHDEKGFFSAGWDGEAIVNRLFIYYCRHADACI